MKIILINPIFKQTSIIKKQEAPYLRSLQLNMFLVNHFKKTFIIIVQQMKFIQLLLGIFILTSIVKGTCSSGCIDCDQQSSICYACGEAYQLTVSGQCRKEEILPHCTLFGPADTCFLCAPTYILQNSVCQKVYDGCLKKDGDSCLTCAFGTTLFGGNCMGAINCETGDKVCSKCKVGFKLQNEVCVDYTGNCQIRQDNGVCRTCKDKYSLIGFQCISSEKRAYGCDIFQEDLTCLSCRGGFELYSGYCLLFWWIQDIKAKMITLDGILQRENIPRIIQQNKQGKDDKENSLVSSGVISLKSQAVVMNQGSTNQQVGQTDIIAVQQPSKDIAKIIPNCQIVEPNTGQLCLQCLEGYINLKNGCFLKVQWCNSYDEILGNCINCSYNLTLQKNLCVDSNCLNSQLSLCVNCKDRFSLDENGVCQFNDVNCMKSSRDRCLTCNSGFILTTQGNCFAIPNYCMSFSPSTLRCQSCQFGFYLSDSNTCQEISLQNCISADTRGNCLNCNQGFYLKEKICQRVSQFCSSYDLKTGICNDCVQGWEIDDGNCYDPNCVKRQSNKCYQCNEGYYVSQNRCLLMGDRNCKLANQTGTCLECKNNYDLFNGSCLIRRIIIDNCLNYSGQTGLCISCIQGYIFSQDQCIVSVSKIQQNTQRKDPNCILYSDIGNCLSCSQRFYLSSIYMLCTAVNSQCNDYDKSTGECISCFSGYIVKQGLCIIGDSSKQNCKNRDSITGRCLNCYSGFYYSQLYSRCVPFNPLCRDSNLTDGSCLTCFSGYSNINGVCILAFSDPNCRQFNSTNCLVCSLGFFLDVAGKCRQVSPLCKIFNTTTGFCLGCYPGYSLSNGNCIVNSALATVDPNCMIYNQNICTKCYRGYYLNASLVCMQANPLCKTIDPTSGFCTACYQGYVINNNQCIIGDSTSLNNCKQVNPDGTCTSCYKNYYLNNNSICISADPLCKSYNDLFTACTNCYDGYQLAGSQCLQSAQTNNSQSNDPNCMAAVNGTCTSCAMGYYLSFDIICKLMNPICKSADSYGSCTDCYQGYIVSNNTCVILQLPNIPYCQAFADQTCTSCLKGYYLKKGACLLINILCDSFDTISQLCIQCRSGYILQGGQCIYPALGPDDNCISYTGTYCSSCKDGFYLKNFICAIIDTNCDVFDKNQGVCISCINGLSPSGSKCI